MAIKRKYVQIANQYIEDVLKGRIVACAFVKKACLRQKEDLVTYKPTAQRKKKYYFDEDAAAKVCYFIENLTHTKGRLAGTPIKLEPWQIFIFTTVFGWRRSSDDGRRFRRVYIEVARGNGKSAMSSGAALYMLCADGELGADIYSFATTRDQAKIVFEDSQVMARNNKALLNHFGIEVLANAIVIQKTNSQFKPMSAEGSTLDGLNTHFGCIDELHAHKKRDVYDVVETSTGKRKNSLLWCITTAGFDQTGICYEVRSMVVQVLNKVVQDETQFGIIYTIDDDDDWTDPSCLEKANPNWGISVQPEVILSLLEKAKQIPSAANNFKTKHLNVWCNAASAWMNMQEWDQSCEYNDLVEYEGRDCFIGLDLGSKSDVTAKVYVFPEENGKKFRVFAHFFLPEDAVTKSTNSQYEGWEHEDFLTVTPGAMTNLQEVEETLRYDLSRFNVQAIAYDPWSATQLASNLLSDGAPMVELRNTVQNLSEPMKWLEAMVLDGRIKHDGNPMLRWMMSNVVAKLDQKGNIFPRKRRPRNKIDGAVALIYAIAIAMSNADFSSEGNFDDFINEMIMV